MSSSFYNEAHPKSLTYLEFGSIDTQKCEKRVWDYRLHQEAYDFLMLARYMKDLVTFKDLTAKVAECDGGDLLKQYHSTVYTRDLYNSVSKLAALHICARGGAAPSFLEMGSTLMGCIEALEFLQHFGRHKHPPFSTLDLKEVNFHGVDISSLLNSVASLVHPDHAVTTHTTRSSLQSSYDVFFAKGVSLLYSISSPIELANLLTSTRIATFDYSFTLDELQQQYLGTGKSVNYLSAQDCLDALSSAAPSKQLWVHEPTVEHIVEKKRIRGLFYCGTPEDLNAVVSEEVRLRKAVLSDIECSAARSCFCYREMEAPVGDAYVPLSKHLSKYQ